MSKALATKNVAAVALALAMVFGFAFAFATPVKADTMTDLQAQVQALLAQIAALQGGSSMSTGAGCHTFTQNLKPGSSGGEVMWVQQFLNGHGFQVSASGAGSPGNETSTFGPATKAAVIKFQNANKADILTPVGLTAGNGNWFASTRAKANAICAGSTGNPGNPGGPVTGGNLVVSASAQPANSLAVAGASRVPFTTFSISNTSGAAVTVNSVTVQRTGLGVDANFSGVVLLDSNGMQVGISKTFNSNHQANVGDNGFTIGAGQTMTFTVAGNISNTNSQTGQVVSIDVVSVNTSATVGGSLPIRGAQHTINTTLALGSVSTSTSSFDPGTAQTKNIGDTNVRFSGVRFTAGSAEDLKLSSIRWRQVGTASSADLSNIVTVVAGTSYPTTVDSTGKYYTVVFPNGGILITKGNSIDVHIQGDLTGSGAAGRTVDFDIDKSTDLYFVGQLYGYGVSPSGSYTPWFNGVITTVNAGSATTIQNASTIASANIPTNVSNTVLGGFITNFRGEPVSVTGMTFSVASTSVAGGPLTNVSLVNSNGVTVAGPVDETSSGTLVFTDTVTFPVGTMTYTLKGKLPAAATNGSTVTLSTTPSTQWTSPTGQVSGNSVTLPSATVTMNAQTVQAATSTIAVASSPSASTIIAGGTNVLISNIQVDATQSGEDIRLSSLPLALTGSGTALSAGLSGCQIVDGSTTLTTGSNVQNPSAAGTVTFAFDNSLTVTKGTTKTLAVQCNIASGVTGTVAFGVTASSFSSGAVLGVQSGSNAGLSVITNAGPTMTVAASASLSLVVDSSSPARAFAAGETTPTTGVLKLHATNGAIIVNRIGFTLANGLCGTANKGAAGNTAPGNCSNDVTTVTIWDGATQVGSATFVGGATATSTLSSPVTVAANSDKLLTVKATLSRIAVDGAGGIGDLVKVDPLNAQATSNGTTVNIGATAGVGGVQLVKTFPTLVNNNSINCSNSTSCQGSNVVIKQFTVSAAANSDNKPVSVWKWTFAVSTSSANVTSLKLFVYDQNGNPVSSQNSGSGQIGSTACSAGCTGNAPSLTFKSDDAGDSAVQISAGQTYTVKLVGTVAPATATWTVTANLTGDTAAQTGIGAAPTVIATTTANVSTSNFVWSDNATTTATTTDVDWFNGFRVPGLSTGSL